MGIKALRWIKIDGELYSIKTVNTVNRWHSIGMTNEKIADNLGLTEKEVVDILNRGRE